MFEIKGIKLATINCAIKYQDRDDVLLVTFDNAAETAGVFTQSSLAATPVKWCQKNLINGKAKALIVNSGNANCFNGEDGQKSLDNVINKVAQEIQCPKDQIFMSSTGVIGEKLDDRKITDKITTLKQKLSNSQESYIKAAKAIMTTDLQEKYDCQTAIIEGQEVKINGIAKGSGMIAPNMATMLAYIFTDANIEQNTLQKILSDINNRTFNAITVDSDQSTNDTVMIFATKTANKEPIDNYNSEKLDDFKEKLENLMLKLAKKIVIDGEGATKLITIEVSGANCAKSAKKIAFNIANSPLVKTAIAGCDPNWGRIIMAIGKSEEDIAENKISIKIGNNDIIKNGNICPNYSESKTHQYLQQKDIAIYVDLGNNKPYSFIAYSCDLTEGYIKINKDYRS